MKLDVLPAEDSSPWYADGLRFTCSQCGNCCTGGPGYVWITQEEVARLADYLGITSELALQRYCRKIGGRISLKERRGAGGSYDCVFLEEQVEVAPGGLAGGPTQRRRTCAVYPVRPLQCRTWPFWPENLSSRAAWETAAKRCHGMNGGRHFSLRQVHAVRDAADWPKDGPTSR